MNKFHILVVDDEESLGEILKFNLEREGYEVTTALSAEEALTLDLAIFDLMIIDVPAPSIRLMRAERSS